MIGAPEDEPVGSHARLFIIAGDETTELDVPDLLGDVYGDSAAELADSYAHLVIATDDSLIVRVGARGRIGISHVSLVDGSVQVLVDGPRCASPVGFVQGRPVFTTQSAEAPAELTVLDGGGERRLTNFASRSPRKSRA